MKRGRPTKAFAALVKARASIASLEDPLDRAEVARLSERFLQARSTLYRDSVETVVELGGILHEGAALKAMQGHFGRWVEDRLGLSATAAKNYMRLAALARRHAWVILRWKELGPSKLYPLHDFTGGELKKVLTERPQEVGGGASRPIRKMNDAEYRKYIDGVHPRVLSRRVTAKMRANGLIQQLRSLRDKVDAASFLGQLRDPATKERVSVEVDLLGRSLQRIRSGLGVERFPGGTRENGG